MKEAHDKPALTPQQARLAEAPGGGWSLYREWAVGEQGLLYFFGYELYTLFLKHLPGLMGYGLRAAMLPHLLYSSGGRPVVGSGVLLRNPGKISLGAKVLLDDHAVLDARGKKARINIGDFVSLGRYSAIVAKDAEVQLAAGVNIGSYCRLATQSTLEIGESTLVAAYCYIGPGNHRESDGETPMIAREMELKGGVKIGAHAWIGARATILDGVSIGDGAIVGAHALVREDIPAGAVAAGIPARIIKSGGL